MKDLKITNNDLTFDSKHELIFLKDHDAIAQDLSHRLRISGLHQQLIGETKHDQTKRDIQLELEKDSRLEAGTVETIIQNETVSISAKLQNGRTINV